MAHMKKIICISLFTIVFLTTVNVVLAQSWSFFGYGDDDGPDWDDYDDYDYWDSIIEEQDRRNYQEYISDLLYDEYIESKYQEEEREWKYEYPTQEPPTRYPTKEWKYEYPTQEPPTRYPTKNQSRSSTGQDYSWLTYRWTDYKGNCAIKGNISYDTGEKIYHIPGWRDYNSTVINTKYGERWFCTEWEAYQAGWRAPYYAGRPSYYPNPYSK